MDSLCLRNVGIFQDVNAPSRRPETLLDWLKKPYGQFQRNIRLSRTTIMNLVEQIETKSKVQFMPKTLLAVP
ncbi:hypothetical protein TNCV_766811 [Trichonephila clavipes]|nr:hypothetical protein TNCV_766811 [Trichonephila clavipes]